MDRRRSLLNKVIGPEGTTGGVRLYGFVERIPAGEHELIRVPTLVLETQGLRCVVELSPEISAWRSICNFSAKSALGPVHHDVAADDSHDRPTGNIPAFVN